MDNITHTLIGVGLARAGLSRKLGTGTTAILAIASNLPDVDAGCLFGGALGFLWRRTPTHSLIGTVFLALAASWIFRHFYPNLSWLTVLGLTALGIGGHVFADLWNAYGVVLFWPFSWRRIDFDWVFIVDLAIWGILIVSWLASLASGSAGVWVWRAGLILLAVYIGICASARQFSAGILRQQSRIDSFPAARLFLYPEPFGPKRFRGVIREDGDYAVYEIRPFQKRIELLERLRADDKSPVVEAARRTRAGRRLEWFFSTAVWRLAPDGKAAIVYGLGFHTRALKGRGPFVFRVTPEGKVSRTRLPAEVTAS
jgi:membrane-bound metal-dependent hydrolase YbcI (DUF457 family)